MEDKKYVQETLPKPKSILGHPITDQLQERINEMLENRPTITEEQALERIIKDDRASDQQERQRGAP